jgi:hypothetical protein
MNMKYVLTLVMAGGALTGLYFWATQEVPGGEQRWQQFVRLSKDQAVDNFKDKFGSGGGGGSVVDLGSLSR